MKKKISVLGLILAAAFVVFTSCEQMLSLLSGEDFTFKSINGSATLTITNYNKVLGKGSYDFIPSIGVGVLGHHGTIKVNKIAHTVELKASNGSMEEIQIINKTIKIGNIAKEYIFDISKLL